MSADGAGSCPACCSWGTLYSGVCRGCYDFARRHEPGPCGACRRQRPLKEGYCRNCHLQAALQAARSAKRAPDLGPAGFAAVRHHQLSFAGVARLNRRPRLPRQQEDPAPAGPPDPRWEQLELTAPGQSRLFHSRHWTAASVSNPALDQARAIASRLAETRGWSPSLQEQTRRALAVMLAAPAPGGKIPWSSLEPALRPRDLSVSRTAEILDLAGLLDDDRTRPLDTWIEGRLATLAPGIAACARNWAAALQHGTSRSLPRSPGTVRIYLRSVHPLLEQWSARYDHLREVTAGDATSAIAALRGHQRRKTLTALRSLTRHCKKNGLIFTDPAARIRATPRPETMILPLPAGRIAAATRAAVTPASRLTLALAAVHALRPDAIRHLTHDSIDLGNRRITIAGQSRPLDDLTRKLISQWLDYRREHWPRTSSPYLLINNQTAKTTRPVSENWLTAPFRGPGATLEQLRIDRQLDEALTAGPDPLHLAAVFALGDETAIRYASAARHLLASTTENQPPALTANPGTEDRHPAHAPPGSR